MDQKERDHLLRRLAQGFVDAYALCLTRGGIEYPDEMRLSDDARVVFNSYGLANFKGGPIDIEIGPMFAASGLSPSAFDNAQLRMWWEHLPDFHSTESTVYFKEDGFMVRAIYEATTPTCEHLTLEELDFIDVNEEGEIRRWEVWEEPAAWDAMTMLAFGKPGRDLTFEEFAAGFRWPDPVA
jgi:hypothetical protein